MLKTTETQYCIADCDPIKLWLEVLYGADQGIRVAVPRYHPEYDAQLQATTTSLTRGEVVTATLTSPDQSSPQWRFDTITETLAAASQ